MLHSAIQVRISKAMVWLGLALLLPITTPALAQAPTQPRGASPSAPASSSADLAAQRQQVAEAFIDLTMAKNYDQAVQYLDPELRDDWPPEKLRERATDFLSRTGAFVKRLNSQVISNVVLVNTQFEKVTDDIVVIFDDNNVLITGIDFPAQPMPTVTPR